jgi:crotonobetainyl-CoA:carnitine CoA-transferase CaiB-like acyl-CoA transferase
VLEFGTFLAGPFATSILGDFGAEVIKVERPGFIDRSRQLGGGTDPADPERSRYFAAVSRNKKSITLDLRHPRGLELAGRLIERSDALVENFQPGTLESWGLGPEFLASRNPDLVVLRISGFGQQGPKSRLAGTDRTAQAFGGLMFVTGHPDRPPVRAGITLADHVTGIIGALGILLALRARDRDRGDGPAGQLIDLSLYDCLLPLLGDQAERYRRFGEVRQRTGNHVPRAGPGDSYLAADGRWVLMSAPSDAIFRKLAETLGRDDWLTDSRLTGMQGREEHLDELRAGIREWIAARSSAETLSVLSDAGIPVSPVNSIADILEDDQIRWRNGFTTVEDSRLGPLTMASPQPSLNRTPGQIKSPAPRLGENNHEVYCGLLGLSEAELAAMVEEKTV